MKPEYDVIVVGGGPAGLTAALYLARARYRVLVVEQGRFGGQIALTETVANYPGIENISGAELSERMQQQAKNFGAELKNAQATGFSLRGPRKTITTKQGEFSSHAVILALGAQPRTVGFSGEEAHRGRGVSYCATCDGAFFAGKDVFVVGGGYAAAEESVFLTKFARHVTVLIRKEGFSCPASVAERARKHEKITVLTNTVLEEVSGNNGLTYARYKNTATGEVTEIRREQNDSFGVFVLAGYAPATGCLQGQVECSDQGYVVTDGHQKTNVPGVFAAGDVCVKPLRQVVTATGDGALAATEAERYLTQLGIHPGGSAPTGPSESMTLDDGTREQLGPILDALHQPLRLKLHLDHRSVSEELRQLMEELARQTKKLTVDVAESDAPEELPYVSICRADGRETGLAFHGVPGGHEFSSFVMGLQCASEPGRGLDERTRAKVAALNRPVSLKILVTLSCSMCPQLVAAAQQLAAAGNTVTAHVYDIGHFAPLQEKYHVLSVPCLVINDETVHFGGKNLGQLLELLGI